MDIASGEIFSVFFWLDEHPKSVKINITVKVLSMMVVKLAYNKNILDKEKRFAARHKQFQIRIGLNTFVSHHSLKQDQPFLQAYFL